MKKSSEKNTFVASPAFCHECGSILPLLREKGNVVCYRCSQQFDESAFENTCIKYTINFNSIDAYTKNAQEEKRKAKEDDDGPVVDRKCPKCGNDKMSYATLQLRSADEGQTVFYTCTKCKYKENENS